MEHINRRTNNFEINVIKNLREKTFASWRLISFSDFEKDHVPGITPAGRTLKQHNLILGFNEDICYWR